MSISREQLARIEDLEPVLLAIGEKEIEADVKILNPPFESMFAWNDQARSRPGMRPSTGLTTAPMSLSSE